GGGGMGSHRKGAEGGTRGDSGSVREARGAPTIVRLEVRGVRLARPDVRGARDAPQIALHLAGAAHGHRSVVLQPLAHRRNLERTKRVSAGDGKTLVLTLRVWIHGARRASRNRTAAKVVVHFIRDRRADRAVVVRAAEGHHVGMTTLLVQGAAVGAAGVAAGDLRAER